MLLILKELSLLQLKFFQTTQTIHSPKKPSPSLVNKKCHIFCPHFWLRNRRLKRSSIRLLRSYRWILGRQEGVQFVRCSHLVCILGPRHKLSNRLIHCQRPYHLRSTKSHSHLLDTQFTRWQVLLPGTFKKLNRMAWTIMSSSNRQNVKWFGTKIWSKHMNSANQPPTATKHKRGNEVTKEKISPTTIPRCKPCTTEKAHNLSLPTKLKKIWTNKRLRFKTFRTVKLQGPRLCANC